MTDYRDGTLASSQPLQPFIAGVLTALMNRPAPLGGRHYAAIKRIQDNIFIIRGRIINLLDNGTQNKSAATARYNNLVWFVVLRAQLPSAVRTTRKTHPTCTPIKTSAKQGLNSLYCSWKTGRVIIIRINGWTSSINICYHGIFMTTKSWTDIWLSNQMMRWY